MVDQVDAVKTRAVQKKPTELTELTCLAQSAFFTY
jgi:hypothetical protein